MESRRLNCRLQRPQKNAYWGTSADPLVIWVPPGQEWEGVVEDRRCHWRSLGLHVADRESERHMDLPVRLHLDAHSGRVLEELPGFVDGLLRFPTHRDVGDLDALPRELGSLLAPQVHADQVRDLFDLRRVPRDDL